MRVELPLPLSTTLAAGGINVFIFSLFFHPPNDGGEVFLPSHRGFFGIDCRGYLGRGHRKAKALRRIQNESEILAHETNGKLRRVVVLLGSRQFSGMSWSDDRSLGQRLQEKFAWQFKLRA